MLLLFPTECVVARRVLPLLVPSCTHRHSVTFLCLSESYFSPPFFSSFLIITGRITKIRPHPHIPTSFFCFVGLPPPSLKTNVLLSVINNSFFFSLVLSLTPRYVRLNRLFRGQCLYPELALFPCNSPTRTFSFFTYLFLLFLFLNHKPSNRYIRKLSVVYIRS